MPKSAIYIPNFCWARHWNFLFVCFVFLRNNLRFLKKLYSDNFGVAFVVASTHLMFFSPVFLTKNVFFGYFTKIGESTIFKAETELCWTQEKLRHTKTIKLSYDRLDTLDIGLFKVTNKRVKQTWESMTQESMMVNLNKSLSSLNYPEPNVYKTH